MLAAGEIDANFVQHVPFMEQYNEGYDASLVGVQPVYLTAVAFYSKTLDSIDELPDGGHVTLPADAANLGRALQMLAEADILTLDPEVEKFQATMDDITDNPRDLEFVEVELLQANAAYEESDAVFNLPAFANQIDLSPFEDGLTMEEDPQFAVTLVTREEDQESPETQALIEAFTSQQVLDVLEEFESTPAF
jgi:D-methionine transport system substrate-binding protein